MIPLPPPATRPFPPLREVRQRIAELKRIDLRNAEIEFLKQRFDPLLDVVSAGPSFQEDHMFYRGRVMVEPPSNASDVGPTPVSLQTKYGRLNRPGQSLMYMNIEPASVFREVKVAAGQTMALACYRATRRLFALSAGFNINAMKARGYIRELPAWCYSIEGALGHKVNQAISQFQAEQFLRDVPVGEEYLYKLSIAWTELMLNGQKVDGISYPSVAVGGRSDNVAFYPTLAGDGLELVRVDFLHIDAIEGDVTHFTFLGKADQFDHQGNFAFRPVPALTFANPTPEGLGYARLERRRWVVRTLAGELISTEQPG